MNALTPIAKAPADETIRASAADSALLHDLTDALLIHASRETEDHPMGGVYWLVLSPLNDLLCYTILYTLEGVAVRDDHENLVADGFLEVSDAMRGLAQHLFSLAGDNADKLRALREFIAHPADW